MLLAVFVFCLYFVALNELFSRLALNVGRGGGGFDGVGWGAAVIGAVIGTVIGTVIGAGVCGIAGVVGVQLCSLGGVRVGVGEGSEVLEASGPHLKW